VTAWAAGTGEAAKAGPLALVVILSLCIACYFLFRSMSRHLKKVRQGLPGQAPPDGGGEAEPNPPGDVHPNPHGEAADASMPGSSSPSLPAPAEPPPE
jgi:hypothetical protein